jgi:hypothetical protein
MVDTDCELPVCVALADLCQVCDRVACLVRGWSGTELKFAKFSRQNEYFYGSQK